MSKQIRNSLILALAALIWGASFVSQSTGGDAVGPFSFNCVRCFIGTLTLLPVVLFIDKKGNSKKPVTKEDKKLLWKGGIMCGIVLFAATILQQLGITMGTASGKAAFITAFYILMVPVLGLFLKRKSPWNVWLAVVIALGGLYLLCVNGSSGIATSDLLLVACAFFFAVQILIVDKYAPMVDGVRLSLIQFLVCGILGIVPMILVDMHGYKGFSEFIAYTSTQWIGNFGTRDAWIALLYSGVGSCGIAYTLQIIGQEDLNPTIASLVMSLESVFGVLTGWLILHERLSVREGMGCIVMMISIVLAQLMFGKKKVQAEENTQM